MTKQFYNLGKYLTDLKIKSVFGGLPIKKDIQALKNGCDILVGTPGRVAALLREKAIDVSNLKFFVVDECDLQINTISRHSYHSVVKITSRFSP